jgi:Flp pilus assembly pilin Flp
MRHTISYLLHDDRGQDLIEYGLLAALISVTAIATMLLIGQTLDSTYTKIEAPLNTVP